MKNNAGGGAIYGIGMLGALVYFLQHATTFKGGVIGILEAIFWPGVILYIRPAGRIDTSPAGSCELLIFQFFQSWRSS